MAIVLFGRLVCMVNSPKKIGTHLISHVWSHRCVINLLYIAEPFPHVSLKLYLFIQLKDVIHTKLEVYVTKTITFGNLGQNEDSIRQKEPLMSHVITVMCGALLLRAC